MGRVHYTNEHIKAVQSQLDELEQMIGWNMRCLHEPRSIHRESALHEVLAELGKASDLFGKMSAAVITMVSPEAIAADDEIVKEISRKADEAYQAELAAFNAKWIWRPVQEIPSNPSKIDLNGQIKSPDLKDDLIDTL
jgi:hypothetical protein